MSITRTVYCDTCGKVIDKKFMTASVECKTCADSGNNFGIDWAKIESGLYLLQKGFEEISYNAPAECHNFIQAAKIFRDFCREKVVDFEFIK